MNSTGQEEEKSFPKTASERGIEKLIPEPNASNAEKDWGRDCLVLAIFAWRGLGTGSPFLWVWWDGNASLGTRIKFNNDSPGD